MEQTFETKDIVTAVYLRANGVYCIGTIPANNKYRPNERLWLFPQNEAVDTLILELRDGDPSVPIKTAFSCASILKNLLNDKDDFGNGEQQK